MFESKKQLKKCVTTNTDVNGMTINCGPIIKYLGAWLDQHMHDCYDELTEDQVPSPIVNPTICSHSCHRFSHLTY